MISAPLPDNEYARLLALARYEILDTPPEAAFDRLTRLASYLLGTPYAFVHLIDQHRIWSKAAVGFPTGSSERASAFCAWTILQDTPLVIENIQLDPRFADLPAVQGEPGLRTYAGAPLTTPSGHRIGTLCVMDTQLHPMHNADLQALQDLADTVVSELELRLNNHQLQREVGAQAQYAQELRRTLNQARVLEGVTSLMDLDLDPEYMTLSAAALLGESIASDYAGLAVFEGDEFRIEAAYVRPGLPQELASLPPKLPHWSGGVTRTLRTATTPVYLDDYALHSGALAEVSATGIQQVAWVPLGTRGQTTLLLLTVRLQDNAVTQWRGSDRALLESAGRSIASALDRQIVTRAAVKQAQQDPLTGLLNRRTFEDDLRAWKTRGQPFTLAMLDLDGFKAVNDQEGHAQGDRVLRVFGSTLSAALDEPARLYRFGGDEFVVLLEHTEEEAVLETVDVAFLAARQVAGLTGVSVGVAYSHEATGNALLELADARMYAVKQRRQALRRAALPETVL
ncbi:sensor domain-containing diguanylate cyclase (plasmid) [Deinococcus sp. KNUC1210]|uniref:sensor domain-containing diguanylate cyclase n=1 Tax=Deinococcus sp. KNUC1210 TaxID=2917691 RepID=UPI001EEFE61F|nr:sensor domain-containing diguanylate cyclase [Deinococcus sp. KNUC1210]ULH17695.1 sensor domain-containing diguanylate cyclase [Deinococcus sp. KNUC1210]